MFLSVQSSNSSGRVIIGGHLQYSCKNTGERFFDRHTVKRRLNWLKNYFRAFPGSWYGNSSGISRHSCLISFSFPSFEVALPEDPFANEITENEWHLLLLFHLKATRCRTATARSDFFSRYRLDVPRVPIMVGEHCDRCSSQAVVCEMWLYTYALWHLFHHVVERSCTKRCAVNPDFVVWGIEVLA